LFSLLSNYPKIKEYSTIILLFIFCGCETVPHPGKEHKFRLFNRVLGRISGLKLEKVMANWKK
jgi:hypothetical protein